MTTEPQPVIQSRPFLELSDDELVGWLTERGQPRFRADQIRRAVGGEKATEFDAITTLPRRLRAELAEAFTIFPSQTVTHQIATDRTEKLLLELHDGHRVECVLMRETSRRTACISTQVGCAMGCVFCASGLLGVKRNLTTAEMLEQVLRLNALVGDGEKVPRLSNLVVMGIGEPMANLRELIPLLDRVTDPDGLGLSPRKITVSTVGLPDAMRTFAEVGKPYRLAVSLHAPNDELRSEIVPVNRGIGINAILEAADEYFTRTSRRVSYEYILLGGVNDHPHLAHQLVARLRGRVAHVNLIPMNDVEELPFRPPDTPRTREFADILEAAGVPVTIRKRKGADIDAACGQLRLKRDDHSTGDPVVVSL